MDAMINFMFHFLCLSAFLATATTSYSQIEDNWFVIPRIAQMPPSVDALMAQYNTPVIFEGGALNSPLMLATPDNVYQVLDELNAQLKVIDEHIPEASEDSGHALMISFAHPLDHKGQIIIDEDVLSSEIFTEQCPGIDEYTGNHSHYLEEFPQCYLFYRFMTAPAYATDKINQSEFKRILFGKGTVSGMHNHEATLLSQCYGRKTAYLVAPVYAEQMLNSCLDVLFDDNALSKQHTLCGEKVSWQSMDNPVYRGELHPGDVLFIPSYWFHDLHAQQDSFSISVASFTE